MLQQLTPCPDRSVGRSCVRLAHVVGERQGLLKGPSQGWADLFITKFLDEFICEEGRPKVVDQYKHHIQVNFDILSRENRVM